MKKIYEEDSDNGNQWTHYYGYVELCIGYCNAVLYARKSNLIDRLSFNSQHKDLMKLLLTEHSPIIEDLCREGKYISILIRRFRQEMRDQGWNWEEQHRRLVFFDIPERN